MTEATLSRQTRSAVLGIKVLALMVLICVFYYCWAAQYAFDNIYAANALVLVLVGLRDREALEYRLLALRIENLRFETRRRAL